MKYITLFQLFRHFLIVRNDFVQLEAVKKRKIHDLNKRCVIYYILRIIINFYNNSLQVQRTLVVPSLGTVFRTKSNCERSTSNP